MFFGLPIGPFELIIIACCALMALGPEKFPQATKVAMKTFRDIRKYMNDAQREIVTELNPMKNELAKFSKVDIENYLGNLIEDAQGPSDDSNEDTLSDEEEVMLTPDEYDNPDEWFEEDEEELVAEDHLEENIAGSEPVEESVSYNPHATTDEDESTPEAGGEDAREVPID